MNLIMENLCMSKYTKVFLDKVPSTNSYAIEQIGFLKDKTVLFTHNQTSGRGRYNRKWINDDTNNLYVTFVFKPDDIENYPFTNLTQYLSLVLCEFLEKEFKLKPNIKWPNDILVDGNKISGILAESYMESNKIKGLVLGLGLNVNLKAETLDLIDQKATSLSVLLGENFEIEPILDKLCDRFFENYDLFVKQGFSFIKERYEQRCNFIGKNIRIRELGEVKEYFAQAIDDDGLLLVKDEFNKEGRIITGDLLC